MDEPSEHPASFEPPHADSGESGQSWSEDEEASFEAADAEARPPKALRHPTQPTAEERIVHDACHLPPRSWCPHCVRGAFKDKPHRATDANIERGVHSFHLDYWFLGESSPDNKGNPRAVSEDASIHLCITMKERETGMVFSHVLPAKGAVDDWVVEQLASHISAVGLQNSSVIYKSEQEQAIVAMIGRLRTRMGGGMGERNKNYDSPSNGVVERAIQEVEKLVRVLKLALGHRVSGKISVNHPILAWLVQHAAVLLNKLSVGRDGRTSYERLRGKPYRGEME